MMREQELAPAPAEAELVTGLPSVPITLKHLPAVNLDKYIPQAGVPRANVAVSREVPGGSPNPPPHMTVLQQHCAFWDRDGDGVIWPWDTYVGFRRLGFNMLISMMAVPAIHMLALYTQPSWIPHPLLPLYLKNVHRTKHGSDSEVYDNEGRFVPQKFEDIFSKYDKGGKGGLSFSDINDMAYANMNVNDFMGWITSRGEWWALWLLCRDANGVVSKEKIRAQYDGTLWQVIADEFEAKKKSKGRSGAPLQHTPAPAAVS